MIASNYYPLGYYGFQDRARSQPQHSPKTELEQPEAETMCFAVWSNWYGQEANCF
jgi:hypothetical protein